MKNSNLLKLLALTGVVVSLSACVAKPKQKEYTTLTYAQLYEISQEEDDDSFVQEGSNVKVRNLAFAGYYGTRVIGQFVDLESCEGLTVETAGLNLKFADSLGYEEEAADLGPYDVFEVEGTVQNDNGLLVVKADKVTRTEKAVIND